MNTNKGKTGESTINGTKSINNQITKKRKSKKPSKWKKKLPYWCIYAFIAWLGNRAVYSFRISEGKELYQKFNVFSVNFLENTLMNPFPSFNSVDFFGGLVAVGIIMYVMYDRKLSRKNFRSGKEYGSARWGTQADIEPFVDWENEDNNIILTQTEKLTMSSGYGAKDRNKNVLILGDTGAMKTRGWVKPNLMQMHSSYVLTDPKGTILLECGKMLERAGYKIKIFNTYEFENSMGYNPFHYFQKKRLEKDISMFVNSFINNTKGEGNKSGEDFWVKAETLLYKAYISLMFVIYPKSACNIAKLCEMVTMSTVDEDDPTFQNPIEIIFEGLEKWINDDFKSDKERDSYEGMDFSEKPTKFQKEIGEYALNSFLGYRLAAGKTAKSILISCRVRLDPFNERDVKAVTEADELEIDKIGDRKTVLFIIVSDTDDTYNFLAAVMYSQMFNLLCRKALKYGGKLPVHIRFILDEFANIGKISNFQRYINVIRSRNMSASIILQDISQLMSVYKDFEKEIISAFNSTLFLGGTEPTLLEWISKRLGKETIDVLSTSRTQGTNSGSYSTSITKIGRELMSVSDLQTFDGTKCILMIKGVHPFMSLKYDIETHKNYYLLADYSEKNTFNVQRYLRERRNRYAKIKNNEKATVFNCN